MNLNALSLELTMVIIGLSYGITLYEHYSSGEVARALASLMSKTMLILMVITLLQNYWLALAIAVSPLEWTINFVKKRIRNNDEKSDVNKPD